MRSKLVTAKDVMQLVKFNSNDVSNMHKLLRLRGVTPARTIFGTAYYDRKQAVSAMSNYRPHNRHSLLYRVQVYLYAQRYGRNAASREYGHAWSTITAWTRQIEGKHTLGSCMCKMEGNHK